MTRCFSVVCAFAWAVLPALCACVRAHGGRVFAFKKKGYVSETWLLDARNAQVYTKVVELEPMEAQ